MKKSWKITIGIGIALLVIAGAIGIGIVVSKNTTKNGTPGTPDGNGSNAVSGPFQTELKYGMEGSPEIALLQTFLIGQKFLNGAPNGDYYTYTQDAVKKFQASQGLSVTGVVNAGTRDLLNTFFTVAPGYFTDDETVSGIGTGQCKAFVTTSPTPGESVAFPLKVSGVVHPKYNTGRWAVFEAVAGTVQVKSLDGVSLSEKTPMVLSGDWMNTDPKPFSVTIPALTTLVAKGTMVDIVFMDDNSAGDEALQHECILSVQLK